MLEQLFIDAVHLIWCHALLLLCISTSQFIDHFLISILELARLIDLRIEIGDDFALDISGHDQVALICDRRIRIEYHIHEAGHAPTEPHPEILRTSLSLW